jgi:hypothetical protein
MEANLAEEMKPHVAQAYKDACDNLIYLKKEQFQITYYTWLLLAALYILSRSFEPGKCVLLLGAVVAGGFSVLTLWHFQASIERMRERLNQIYRVYFTDQERIGLGLDATTQHAYVVGVLTAICVVATGFTAWAIWRGPD